MGNKPGTGQKINHIRFITNNILVRYIIIIQLQVVPGFRPQYHEEFLCALSIEKYERIFLSYSPNFGTV